MDPSEPGQRDIGDGFPRAGLCRPVDEFGLVVAIDRFGEGVIEAVTDGADGGHRTDLGEPFTASNGCKLRPCIGVTSEPGQHFPRDQRAISMASRTMLVRM